MKKMHDQLLRNIHAIIFDKDESNKVSMKNRIHAEILKSYALPARQYVTGFGNLRRVFEIATNEQHDSLQDIEILLNAALFFTQARSHKQHRAPEEFINYIVTQLNVILDCLKWNKPGYLLTELQDTIKYIDDTWFYQATREKVAEYKKEHFPHLPEWHHYGQSTPQEKADWEKLYAYERSIRCMLAIRFRWFLYSIHGQTRTILEVK